MLENPIIPTYFTPAQTWQTLDAWLNRLLDFIGSNQFFALDAKGQNLILQQFYKANTMLQRNSNF